MQFEWNSAWCFSSLWGFIPSSTPRKEHVNHKTWEVKGRRTLWKALSQNLGTVLAVTEGLLLFWEWMGLEVWGYTQGQKGTVNIDPEGARMSLFLPRCSQIPWKSRRKYFLKPLYLNFLRVWGSVATYFLTYCRGSHCFHSGQTLRNGRDQQNR